MEKEVRIAIKSEQTSNQLERVTRNISCIGYSYISKPSACTNKAFSSTSTRFNPYFGWYKIILYMQNTPAKVGIKSCRCAREYFTCAYIWL